MANQKTGSENLTSVSDGAVKLPRAVHSYDQVKLFQPKLACDAVATRSNADARVGRLSTIRVQIPGAEPITDEIHQPTAFQLSPLCAFTASMGHFWPKDQVTPSISAREDRA